MNPSELVLIRSESIKLPPWFTISENISCIYSQKRLLDIFVASILLILSAPLMIIVSLFILLTFHGPIIFKQERIGLNEKIFTIYKFRSMYVGTEKITYIGKYIRRFHIDELPQLWNVLKGDMGIVGPRADIAKNIIIAQEELPNIKKRFTVKPGITGLLQVIDNKRKIRKGGYKNVLPIDLAYVQSCCLKNDLKILFRTIWACISANGV